MEHAFVHPLPQLGGWGNVWWGYKQEKRNAVMNGWMKMNQLHHGEIS